MGFEQDSVFYDSRLEKVMLPLETSPWKDLYEMVASFIPRPEEKPKIVDVGCGTGRFASLLMSRGYTNYWGIDFSRIRIAEARKYVPEFKDYFECQDALSAIQSARFYQYNVFIFIDFLEHIAKDIEILSAVPNKSQVIIAVPSFDSDGHVRYFKTANDVIHRYSDILQFDTSKIFENIRKISKKNTKKIFIFSTFKF